MPPNPYQRILMNGVPVWKDAAGSLFYYETSAQPTADTRIQIGTEANGLSPDWKARLEQKLQVYRETSQTRARAAKS
jgi:hypothetical protein